MASSCSFAPLEGIEGIIFDIDGTLANSWKLGEKERERKGKKGKERERKGKNERKRKERERKGKNM